MSDKRKNWKAVNNGPHWNAPDTTNWTIHYGDDQEHIVDHVYEEADAHLIAAAPQMLMVLKMVRHLCEHYAEEADNQAARDGLEAVDLVIAKAEGK